MKKRLLGGGVASLVTALAFAAAPLSASADFGDICAFYVKNPGQASNCEWYADVPGEYGGSSGGPWYVLQWVPGISPSPLGGAGLCGSTGTTDCWSVWDSGGAGPIAWNAIKGKLPPGHTYSLAITGKGGGELGSATGTGAI